MFRELGCACHVILSSCFRSCPSETALSLKTSRERCYHHTGQASFWLPPNLYIWTTLNILYYILLKAKPIMFLQIFLLLICVKSLFENFQVPFSFKRHSLYLLWNNTWLEYKIMFRLERHCMILKLERPYRNIYESGSESRSVVSDSLQPNGLYSPWDSPGQNTGVG